MSLRVKATLTCDEPGCEETRSVLVRVWIREDLAEAAPDWQLPRLGDLMWVHTYCPRHRRPA